MWAINTSDLSSGHQYLTTETILRTLQSFRQGELEENRHESQRSSRLSAEVTAPTALPAWAVQDLLRWPRCALLSPRVQGTGSTLSLWGTRPGPGSFSRGLPLSLKFYFWHYFQLGLYRKGMTGLERPAHHTALKLHPYLGLSSFSSLRRAVLCW